MDRNTQPADGGSPDSIERMHIRTGFRSRYILL
jgi:hypothetical protein